MAAETAVQSEGWQTVHSLPTQCNISDFVRALMVWIEKPHVVNRRLVGAVILDRFYVHISDQAETRGSLFQDISGRIIAESKLTSRKAYMETIKECRATFALGEEQVQRDCFLTEAIFLKLLPKQQETAQAVIELVLLTHNKGELFEPTKYPNC